MTEPEVCTAEPLRRSPPAAPASSAKWPCAALAAEGRILGRRSDAAAAGAGVEDAADGVVPVPATIAHPVLSLGRHTNSPQTGLCRCLGLALCRCLGLALSASMSSSLCLGLSASVSSSLCLYV
eukprot:gene5043-133_t